jgi:anaerobic magnesium-protoporphyrin IX monomethyl ester cyclase
MKKGVLFLRLCSNKVKENFHIRNSKPPLYFGYISALLKNDGLNPKQLYFLDQFVDNINIDDILKYIETNNILVVIISFETCDKGDLLFLLPKLTSVFKVGIGQEVTSNSDFYIEKGFDALVIGESETPSFNIVKKILSQISEYDKKLFDNCLNNLSGIDGVKLKIGQDVKINLENISNLPSMDYELINCKTYKDYYPVRLNKKLKWGYVLTSRGCPFKCIFCSNTIRESYGNKVRNRNVIDVYHEIEEMVKKYKINIISIRDDNFGNSKFITDFCNKIIENKLDVKWIAQMRVDSLEVKLISLMKKAGCVNLRFGIESGSVKILKVLKKTNNPELWDKKALQIFNECKRNDITTVAFFILGSPHETIYDIKLTSKLIKKLSPDFIQIAFFTLYPGSSAYKEAKIRSDKVNDVYHYSFTNTNLSNIKQEDLIREYKNIYLSFYLNPLNILRQYYKYSVFYLFNLDIWFKLFLMTLRIKK